MTNQRNLDEAMLRAYSEARCLDYGFSIEDVRQLRERVQHAEHWCDVALELAEIRIASAGDFTGDGVGNVEACAELLHAAACLRAAQAALEEHPPQRLLIYQRQVATFKRAMRLFSVHSEFLEVEWKGAPHGAWLFPYEGSSRWVVIWGGADGWREAYHRSVQFFHKHRLSVCLLELPGQGIARLQQGSYLEHGFTSLVSSVLDALTMRGGDPTVFALVGHSIGGALALRAAATEKRIVACVTNGGSVEPEKGLTAYPRVLRRFARMLGDSVDSEEAISFIERLELTQCAKEMHASLLCIHGGKDELVADSEAHRLVALHGRADLRVWQDGTHCVYNHANERNHVLAAWVSEKFDNLSI